MLRGMDARPRKQKIHPQEDEAWLLAETIAAKRDRLLASLTLIAGIGALVALPFALRAGAEFFMPVTAALVVAIALVPLLEWFERRGMPSKGSAGLCVLIFLAFAIFAIGSIVVPATRLGGADSRPKCRRCARRWSRSSSFTITSTSSSTRPASQIAIVAGEDARRSTSKHPIRCRACCSPPRRTC